MSDEQKDNSASEVINKSASAANAVRGAVKVGKAVSGAAKGAAVGGPYGAVAMMLWENRKVLGKIAIGLIAFMMLPVIFVSMLPAMLFGVGGSETAADNEYNWDESKVEQALLEDDAVIFDNTTEACAAVDEIMSQAHASVLNRIQSDFAGYGANSHLYINDPYSAVLPYDSTTIICQYSASDDGNGSVNIDKLKETLNAHSDSFYSYTATTSTYPVTVQVQQPDGTWVEVVETHTDVTYTISYIGNDYFADTVFGLNDEQKALAEDYADSLKIFLDEEED